MFQNFPGRLSSWIYPVRCPVCSDFIEYGEDFCDECKSKFTENRLDRHIDHVEKFVAPFEYNAEIAPAIILMKDGIFGNAPYAFGKAVAEKLQNCEISSNIDFIIPVPLHKKDLKRRGENQSFLIAREIGKILKIPVRKNIVVKTLITAPQKNLSREMRLKNLKGAFSITDKSAILNRRILIIDDICTTGSTFEEIAKLLMKNGASKIYCASCCSTHFKGVDTSENSNMEVKNEIQSR